MGIIFSSDKIPFLWVINSKPKYYGRQKEILDKHNGGCYIGHPNRIRYGV